MKSQENRVLHLYEHLMFQRETRHDNDGYFKLFAIGATDLNGTTNNDRTNYFENVPISVLDKVYGSKVTGWVLC